MIPSSDVPGLFYRGLTETYTDRMMPKPLFTSMSQITTSKTLYVGVETQRYNETVAVDIRNGRGGNRNQFSRSDVTIYEPPTFNEEFDLTTLEIYDRVFGRSGSDEADMAQLIDTVADKVAFLTGKIQRATELHWSQIMQNGIVILKNGDNIDYRRKAASMVNRTGAYWDGSNATILQDLRNGGNFLRQEGKIMTHELMAVMGQGAFDAMINSSEIQNLGDQKLVVRVDLQPPADQMTGGVYHGTVSAGSYKVHIYTYPEYYTDFQGVTRQYWPDNMVVMYPKNGYRFSTKHAAIRALFKGNDSMPQYFGYVREKFFINNFIDQKNSSHTFQVHSRPLPVPVSVDQIYTLQVLAS